MPPKTNNNKHCLTWTRAMDDALVDAFMHQHELGNKVNGTFTTTAYENIVKEIGALFDIEIDKERVKNRWKTLKKNFSEVWDIFKGGLSGFAWNPSTQLWEAEDQVWDALIQSKPKASHWRTTSFPNYDKMIILYGYDRASGEEGETLNEMRKRHHSIIEEDFTDTPINNIDNLVAQHAVSLENFKVVDDSVNQDMSHGATSGSSKKKTKVGSKKEKETDLCEIKGVIAELAEAIREGNQVAKESCRKILQLSGEEVVRMIKECGCPSNKIAKVYKVLMGDGDLLRTFIECPVDLRKELIVDL